MFYPKVWVYDLLFKVCFDKSLDTQRAPEGDDDESSQSESVDPLEAEEANNAAKQRKRAGVPELELDQLPSTISTKMLILVSCFFLGKCRYEPISYFRTCNPPSCPAVVSQDLLGKAIHETERWPSQVPGSWEAHGSTDVETFKKYLFQKTAESVHLDFQ